MDGCLSQPVSNGLEVFKADSDSIGSREREITPCHATDASIEWDVIGDILTVEIASRFHFVCRYYL